MNKAQYIIEITAHDSLQNQYYDLSYYITVHRGVYLVNYLGDNMIYYDKSLTQFDITC